MSKGPIRYGFFNWFAARYYQIEPYPTDVSDGPAQNSFLLGPSRIATAFVDQFHSLGLYPNASDGNNNLDYGQQPIMAAAVTMPSMFVSSPNSQSNVTPPVQPSLVYGIRQAQIQAIQLKLLGAP